MIVVKPLCFRKLSHSSKLQNDALMHREGPRVNPLSAGTVFIRQNLTSRPIKTDHALKALKKFLNVFKGIQMKLKKLIKTFMMISN